MLYDVIYHLSFPSLPRRTADVRSVGYLELFVLSREDVLAALKDHPEAEVGIEAKAKQIGLRITLMLKMLQHIRILVKLS